MLDIKDLYQIPNFISIVIYRLNQLIYGLIKYN